MTSPINTKVKLPNDFINEAKRYKSRFNLVKKKFEDSYPDYKLKMDTGKNNVRSREQWDELFNELVVAKASLKNKSFQYNQMVESLSKEIKKQRKKFFNKSKQDKINSQILTAAKPLKIQKYDNNLNTIVETIYYSLGIIIMGSYIIKMYSKQ